MKCMFTGNYNNCKRGNIISISGDKGKLVGYIGNTYTKLAPKKYFWSVWHNNIDKISVEENTKYYIENYYNKVLKNLDPEQVLNELPNNPILLCYEDSNDFCHRHLVAFWLELFLGIKTYEVKENPITNKLIIQDRPEYLKNILKNVIKENYNMRSFNSIKAAYLFECSIELEQLLNDKTKNKSVLLDTDCEMYSEVARLRIEADNEEYQYILKK